MQDEAFISDEYQQFRTNLVEEVYSQILRLSLYRVDVKMKRKFLDKFLIKDSFVCISEQDKSNLIENIADLVSMKDKDDKAIEFDNLIYGLMLSSIEGTKIYNRLKNQTVEKANILLKKTTIPQVKAKLPVLKEIREAEFWNTTDIIKFEKIRIELRDLMKFATLDKRDIVYTNLRDVELEREILKEFTNDFDFQDYKLKVNNYIEENKNNTAIYKLRNNIPLSQKEYKTLEKIFTGELGTKEDYENNFLKVQSISKNIKNITKHKKISIEHTCQIW
jgi:type I restriction enzyme, R subunit